jgi:hypothetical protein
VQVVGDSGELAAGELEIGQDLLLVGFGDLFDRFQLDDDFVLLLFSSVLCDLCALARIHS